MADDMTQTHSEQTARGEVEQVDREAAATLAEQLECSLVIGGNDLAAIRNGFWDSEPGELGDVVRAFARHRLASLSPADNGALGEALKRVDGDWKWLCDQLEQWPVRVHPERTTSDSYLRECAAAIIRAALSTTPDAVRGEVDLREAARLAYGLLWHMQIDTRDPNLKLASAARNALLSAMTKDDQYLGIDAAKMTDARFTGAA